MSLNTIALRALRASGKRLSKRNYKAACVVVSRPTPTVRFCGVTLNASRQPVAAFSGMWGIFLCDLESLELRIRNGLRCGVDVSQDRRAFKALKSAIRKSKVNS